MKAVGRDWAEEKEQPPNGTALNVIAVLATVVLLRYAQDLLIPIVLSVLIAYALTPMVDRLAWLRLPRAIAAASVLLVFLGGAGYGMYALRGQANAVIELLPEAAEKVRQTLQEFRRAPAGSTSTLTKLQRAVTEIEKTAADAAGSSAPPQGIARVRIAEPGFRAYDHLWSGSMGFLTFLGQLLMMSFLVFFALASGDLFKRKLMTIIGTRISEKRVTLEVINEINSQIARFLQIQILTGALVGAATALVLWAFGVGQPVFWGVAAGVLNSIPYFGAIIVTCGLALVAFLQFGTLSMTVEVAGATLAITSLEGFLLTPALMGKAAGINGVAMFLSLLFWSWLWGVVGTIVAVPIMMAVKTVCDRIESLKPVGELLGER